MRKGTKIALIIATALLVLGGMIFSGAMSFVQWDFGKMSLNKPETNEYVLAESYQDILIETRTADVVILPSETEETTVVCKEQERLKHKVTVSEDTLTIKLVDTRKWHDYLFDFANTQITVYVPTVQFGKISVKSSTGDVKASDCICDDLQIKNSTGDVVLQNVFAAGKISTVSSTGDVKFKDCDAASVYVRESTGDVKVSDCICDDLQIKNSTGDVVLQNVFAAGKISIVSSTGDVKFKDCDAASVYVRESTGDVKGNFLTEKRFVTKTGTGDIHVPKSEIGGYCEIITSTGDIRFTIG